MKRLISLCLCTTLLVPTFVYAKPAFDENDISSSHMLESKVESVISNNFEKYDLTKSETKQVLNDVETLESLYIPFENLTELKENSDSSYSYIYNMDGIISEITPLTVDDGKGYIAKEGDKRDELIITNDGEIYLDGNLVEVTTDDTPMEEINGSLYINGEKVETIDVSDEDTTTENNMILRGGRINSYCTKTCPTGTSPDDYQLLYRYDNTATINFRKSICNLTFSSFLSIFCIGLNNVTGAAISIASGILQPVFEKFVKMDPTSKFASVKDWVYTHYEGQDISLTRAAWQHSIYGWINAEYAGKAVHQVYYEIRDNEM